MNDFEREFAQKSAELSKEIASDVIRPTSTSIGKNLGLIVEGVFGWLGNWGQKQIILQKVSIEDFKDEINRKIAMIDLEKLIEPKISIVGPAIDACKYYFDEEYYKELFSNLIAASCDKDYAEKIHPSFIEIIKQLSSIDVKFLNLFTYNMTYPMASVMEIAENKIISPYPIMLFDFKDRDKYVSEREQVSFSASLDNLTRLGLILKNKAVIELDYDYNIFNKHFMFVQFDKLKKPGSIMKIDKFRIELSLFGQNFLDCCVSSNYEKVRD